MSLYSLTTLFIIQEQDRQGRRQLYRPITEIPESYGSESGDNHCHHQSDRPQKQTLYIESDNSKSGVEDTEAIGEEAKAGEETEASIQIKNGSEEPDPAHHLC